MTSPALLWVTSGVVLVACLGLVVLIVATKVMRTRRGRTAEALVAPFRADLLAVSVGEDPDGAHLARLSAADGPARLAVDEAMVRFLGKVRGMPAEQLQEVLQKHGATKRALRQLHDRSPVHRALAAQLLGLCHEQAAVPRLVECLADPAPEVRASAVDALGRIGNPTAAPPVLAAVGAGRAVPAGAAADALEDMGVGISEALRTALADGDPTTRAVAAYLSGAGSFTRSIPGLRRLTAEDPDVTVRITAARALGRIGRSQDVQVLMRQTSADRPSELRRAGAAALGDLGEPSATQGLRALVHDDDPRLAELAASALLRLGEEGRAALTTASGAPVESALLLERLRSQVA